jgi:hypothetical protein
MAMGPWSEPPKAKATAKAPRASGRGGEWALIAALVALCVLAALTLWGSRYELGSAGGMATRLDRLTGQVIGCDPAQGCVEVVPAGAPALHKPAVAPAPTPQTAEGEAAAATAAPAR